MKINKSETITLIDEMGNTYNITSTGNCIKIQQTIDNGNCQIGKIININGFNR